MKVVSKRALLALVAGLSSVAGLSGCNDDDVQRTLPSSTAGQAQLSDTPSVSPPLQAPPDTNSAPTISGNMPTVVEVGKAFSFVPSATDADNDALQFTISGKPRWSTFDSKTGRLTGTPTQADVGVQQVVISVNDGLQSASLPKTNLTVQATTAATVAATISWTPPTQNVDGTALVNLSGYEIHYGTNSQQYTKKVSVSASLTRYVIEGLTPGMYYFSITALTSNGTKSVFAPEVSGEIG